MLIAFNMSSVEDIYTVTGVGQHQLNIVKGIADLGLLNSYIFLTNETVDKQLRLIYPKISTYNYGKQLRLPRSIKKFYYLLNLLYLNRFVIPKAVKRINPDVIFQPFNCISIKTKWKQPYALMVLDMYHRFFPQCMRKSKYRLVVNRHNAMMKGADLIITSSDVNKGHIEGFYPKTKSMIKVIPVPIDIDTTDIEVVDIEKPYILCVNSLRYHKNIHTLIKAFKLIEDRIKHNLVLIGTESADEANNIENKSNRIIFTGYISSKQRNYLYCEADLFVSSTMFEGFGMTPLEAMLFKRKVLVSDIPVMRESTFNSAEYFEDIENEEVLAGRILEMLDMDYDKIQMNKIAEKILKIYSPANIAQKIHENLIELGNKHENSN